MCQKTIMLVCANTLWRSSVCHFFNRIGYNCVGVNPEESMQIYITLNPDLILMDIVMRDKDGITCCKEIMSYNSKAKIIILALLVLPETMISALELGIQDIIEKTAINPADYNDMMYNRVRDAFLCTQKYDLNIVKNKLSIFPVDALSQLEIDDILLSSRIKVKNEYE